MFQIIIVGSRYQIPPLLRLFSPSPSATLLLLLPSFATFPLHLILLSYMTPVQHHSFAQPD